MHNDKIHIAKLVIKYYDDYIKQVQIDKTSRTHGGDEQKTLSKIFKDRDHFGDQ